MTRRAVQAHAANSQGDSVTLHAHEDTDYPILPVTQLEQLHALRPDLVDFVIEQTKIEADTRRQRSRRIDHHIFVERLLGQLFAFLIGIAGVGAGAYVGVNGQPWLAGVIVSAALGTLALAFLGRKPVAVNKPENKET